MNIFPIAEYWWLYIAFTGLILVLLWIDLALHRSKPAPGLGVASIWASGWILTALGFCGVLYWFVSAKCSPAIGRQLSMEFIAGFVVEKSLSVDNMFVFALIFRHFALPPQYQHRVLFYGVLGAIVFRGIFIALGVALLRFEWVLIAFGVFLIISGARLFFEREGRFDPGASRIMRMVCRLFPATPELHGSSFITRIGGRRHATPLLITLLFLEFTDLVFATDSVPAVLGVTREPFVVYSSNIFAVLGLRAMFFVLSSALDRFHALKYGLAGVLVFVGVKMIWLDRLFGGRFPILVSLGIIGAVIVASVAASLAFPKRDERLPAPHGESRQSPLGVVTGVVFVILSAAATWCAVDPVISSTMLPAMREVDRGALCTSAICLVVCGVILIRGSNWRRSR